MDKHVSPKVCFVWYANSKEGWTPMPGTGCAHWVAHEKGYKGGSVKCDEGYPCRVKDVVAKIGSVVTPDQAKPGYVWIEDGKKHCGIVRSVMPGKDPKAPTILIEHCSTKLGRVGKSDWAKYFKSKGAFHKA